MCLQAKETEQDQKKDRICWRLCPEYSKLRSAPSGLNLFNGIILIDFNRIAFRIKDLHGQAVQTGMNADSTDQIDNADRCTRESSLDFLRIGFCSCS